MRYGLMISAGVLATSSGCQGGRADLEQPWQPSASGIASATMDGADAGPDGSSTGQSVAPDSAGWPGETGGAVPMTTGVTDGGSTSVGPGQHTSSAGDPGGSTGAPNEPDGGKYIGGWDIGDCQDDIVPGGSTIDDFELTDQFGEKVRLYDFCHKTVLLTAGSFW